jgi:hypothetical protein
MLPPPASDGRRLAFQGAELDNAKSKWPQMNADGGFAAIRGLLRAELGRL